MYFNMSLVVLFGIATNYFVCLFVSMFVSYSFDCITGPILNSLATKPLTLYLSFLPADQEDSVHTKIQLFGKEY